MATFYISTPIIDYDFMMSDLLAVIPRHQKCKLELIYPEHDKEWRRFAKKINARYSNSISLCFAPDHDSEEKVLHFIIREFADFPEMQKFLTIKVHEFFIQKSKKELKAQRDRERRSQKKIQKKKRA